MEAAIVVSVESLVPDILKLVGAGADAGAFSHTIATLNALAYAYQAQWVSFAMGEQIPGVPRVIKSGAEYAKSIHVDINDDFTKSIYTDSPNEKYIEEGHGEIDLKPGLLHGAKARMTKEGTPYNIVAFRQGTPGAINNPMPMNLYEIAKRQFDAADEAKAQGLSKIGGTSRIVSTNPLKYEWGIRMGKGFGGPPQTVGGTSERKLPYTHLASKYAGMVRLQMGTEQAKRTGYLTFRVVSVHSDPASWIVPKLEGIDIRRAVVNKMHDQTVELLKDAIEQDLKGGGSK